MSVRATCPFTSADATAISNATLASLGGTGGGTWILVAPTGMNAVSANVYDTPTVVSNKYKGTAGNANAGLVTQDHWMYDNSTPLNAEELVKVSVVMTGIEILGRCGPMVRVSGVSGINGHPGYALLLSKNSICIVNGNLPNDTDYFPSLTRLAFPLPFDQSPNVPIATNVTDTYILSIFALGTTSTSVLVVGRVQRTSDSKWYVSQGGGKYSWQTTMGDLITWNDQGPRAIKSTGKNGVWAGSQSVSLDDYSAGWGTAGDNPATKVYICGSNFAAKNYAAGPYTIGVDGIYTGTVTITPSDGSVSGSPLTWSGTQVSQTVTYTATTTGAKTLTLTNSGSLANSSPLAVRCYDVSTISGCQLQVQADVGTGQTIDGTTITAYTDQSGVGNNGTASGGVTFKTGILNNLPSMRFATNGYIDFGSPAAMVTANNNRTFTILCLMKQTSQAAVQFIWSKMDYTQANDVEFAVANANLTNANQLGYTYGTYGGGGSSLPLTNALPASTVVMTGMSVNTSYPGLTSTTGVYHIYVNGMCKGTTIHTLAASSPTNAKAFLLGAAQNAGGTKSDYFLGDMFEFAFFNRELTSAEVLKWTKYMWGKYNLPPSYGNREVIIFDGDSMTSSATNGYTANYAKFMGLIQGMWANFGVSSENIAGNLTAAATFVDPLITELTQDGAVAWSSIFEYFNQTQFDGTQQKIYLDARRTAGASRTIVFQQYAPQSMCKQLTVSSITAAADPYLVFTTTHGLPSLIHLQVFFTGLNGSTSFTNMNWTNSRPIAFSAYYDVANASKVVLQGIDTTSYGTLPTSGTAFLVLTPLGNSGLNRPTTFASNLQTQAREYADIVVSPGVLQLMYHPMFWADDTHTNEQGNIILALDLYNKVLWLQYNNGDKGNSNPAVADVRSTLSYNNGVSQGTLAVPAASDVRAGTAIDAGVGTLASGGGGSIRFPQLNL